MRQIALGILMLMSSIAMGQVPASGPTTAPAAFRVPATLPAQTRSASTQSVPTTAAWAPPTAPSTLPTTNAVAATMPTTAAIALTTAPTTASTQLGYASTAPTTAQSNYSSYSSDRYRYRSYTPSYGTPTPAPAYNGPDLRPKPITAEYYVLLRRSIFIRGRQAVSDPGDGTSRSYYATDAGGPTTSLSTQPTTTLAWSPENTMVFNGASDANGQTVAFIENTSLNSIARFHVGDQVATGRITAITLDQLDYAVGDRVTHVMLGQNLSGIDTQVLTTQAVTGGAGPTSGPAGGMDDVLERLRRRRLQELGGQ